MVMMASFWILLEGLLGFSMPRAIPALTAIADPPRSRERATTAALGVPATKGARRPTRRAKGVERCSPPGRLGRSPRCGRVPGPGRVCIISGGISLAGYRGRVLCYGFPFMCKAFLKECRCVLSFPWGYFFSIQEDLFPIRTCVRTAMCIILVSIHS